MARILARVLGMDGRKTVSIVYTEEEFIACLLVNGWVKFHDYDNSQMTYWNEVDVWFRAAWPDRWLHLGSGERDATRGQMEFKIQFWTWGREIFDTPVLSVGAPLK